MSTHADYRFTHHRASPLAEYRNVQSWSIRDERGDQVAVVIGPEEYARLIVAGVNRETARKMKRARKAGVL